MAPFAAALESAGSRVLELGCGPGLDAAWLTDRGFSVVGCDRSLPALLRACLSAPAATFLGVDIARPLPFRAGCFDVVVSSLALHYFTWSVTRAVVAEVRRVVSPSGRFLFRVNASDDIHHGAGSGEEVERGFVRGAGRAWGYSDTKRFFDEQMVRAALADYFAIESVNHRTIRRYQPPKQVWECLALPAAAR